MWQLGSYEVGHDDVGVLSSTVMASTEMCAVTRHAPQTPCWWISQAYRPIIAEYRTLTLTE